MPAFVFLTHIPLLRLEQDEVPFADGELTRLPWELYDQLSLGAFSDFQPLYEQTAPVFYRLDVPDLPQSIASSTPSAGGMLELTAPTREWDTLLPELGLGWLLGYSDHLVEPAWTALLLAAAAAAPPRPRMSVTFVVRGEENASFEFQGRAFDGIRVSGETNQQLLFSPDAAGEEISAGTVEHADELIPLVETAGRHPRLSAAIAALQASTHPSLSPRELTTLAVVALEALLLPEIESGLTKTFGRRVATLLAAEPERPKLDKTARRLYDERSVSLHGMSERPAAAPSAAAGYAQRLLAAAIEALAHAAGEDGDVPALCEELDGEGWGGTNSPPDPDVSPGLAAVNRLTARAPKISAGFSLGDAESMAPEEGILLSWSPLVGLTSGDDIGLGEGSGLFLTTRSPASVLTLEDKDVQRDLGDIRMADTRVACLGVARAAEGEDIFAVAEPFLHARDLVVVALRLAGFSAFVDPELLGSFLFQGRSRLIATTVLAPTILRSMARDPTESVEQDGAKRLASVWRIVAEYDAAARHDEVDHILTLFRRSHDDEYVPPGARASLLLAVIEATLGRFRPPTDAVQLEDLVQAITGPESADAAWFARSGRQFRNAVAHGYWDGDRAPLAALEGIGRHVVLGFLESHVAAGDHTGRPTRDYVDQVVAGKSP